MVKNRLMILRKMIEIRTYATDSENRTRYTCIFDRISWEEDTAYLLAGHLVAKVLSAEEIGGIIMVNCPPEKQIDISGVRPLTQDEQQLFIDEVLASVKAVKSAGKISSQKRFDLDKLVEAFTV